MVTGGLALAGHFGDGVLRPADVAAGVLGAVVRDPAADRAVWQEYLETVVRERDGWKRLLPRLPGGVGMTATTARDRAAGGPLLLGVRHHGPGSARALRAALDAARRARGARRRTARRGRPRGARRRRGHAPPVALLAHAADDPGKAAFWPLAAFSPEWVAIRWALGRGAAVRFADLPAAHTLAMMGGPPGTRGGRGGRRGGR